MTRVFSAVDVKDERLLKELEDVRDSINIGFKPVPRDKMHITFQFFENLGTEQIKCLKAVLDNVNTGSFTTSVKGVGAFPSRDYIRVLWAGLEEQKFNSVYKQVCSHKIRSDNSHEFKPHITFLRVKNIDKKQKAKLQKMLKEYKTHKFGEFEVDNIKLYKSSFNGQKTEYKEIHSIKL